jgi:hypothetical protein
MESSATPDAAVDVVAQVVARMRLPGSTRVLAALSCCTQALRLRAGPEVQLGAALSIQRWWRQRALPRRALMRRLVSDWIRSLAADHRLAAEGWPLNLTQAVVLNATTVWNPTPLPLWHPCLAAARRRYPVNEEARYTFAMLTSLMYLDQEITANAVSRVLCNEYELGDDWFRLVVNKAPVLEDDPRRWIEVALQFFRRPVHRFPSMFHSVRARICPADVVRDVTVFLACPDSDEYESDASALEDCLIEDVIESVDSHTVWEDPRMTAEVMAYPPRVDRVSLVREVDEEWSADDNRLWREAFRFISPQVGETEEELAAARLRKYRLKRFVDALARRGRRLRGRVWSRNDHNDDKSDWESGWRADDDSDSAGEPDDAFDELGTREFSQPSGIRNPLR